MSRVGFGGITAAPSGPLVLDEVLIGKYRLGKVWKENKAPINSLDFTPNGDYLVSSSNDHSINLYNCNSGTLRKTVFNKSFGTSLVRFTHHPNAVILASNNGSWDETIRYLSLHDNRFLRYFKGHKKRVTTLELSPNDDTFISGSLDKTIRFWDLRASVCQGMVRTEGSPAVAFDPQGYIFALAWYPNTIKLYDVNKYDAGPFATMHINHQPLEITGMKFSPDGKLLLVATMANKHFLLDSFTGAQKTVFTSHVNKKGMILECSFSPDGGFVLGGSEDGTVHIWETKTGRLVRVLTGHPEDSPVTCVRWNPTRHMIASAGTQLGAWIPKLR